MNIPEQAETFRLLLLMGLIDKSQVITWADNLIDALPTVPDWLLDVSLAANDDADTIGTKLKLPPGDWNPLAAAFAAFNLFAQEFRDHDRFTSQQAAHLLDIWACNVNLKQDDFTMAMLPSWLADDAANGRASDHDVLRAIKTCIEHFTVKYAHNNIA